MICVGLSQPLADTLAGRRHFQTGPWMELLFLATLTVTVVSAASSNLLARLEADVLPVIEHLGVQYLTVIQQENDSGFLLLRQYSELLRTTGIRMNVLPWRVAAGTAYQQGAVLVLTASDPWTAMEVGQSSVRRPLIFYCPDDVSIPSRLANIEHISFRSRVYVVLRDRVDASRLVLSEVYHVQENMTALTVNEVGFRDGEAVTWRFSGQSELRRRSNLQGAVLRAIYPILMFDKVDISGLARGVWAAEIFLRTLTGALNLSIEQHRLDDRNLLGSPDKSGRWPGIIGVLQRDDADISVLATSPSLRHANHVDFLAAIFPIEYKLYYRTPVTLFSLETMINGFTLETWTTTGGFFLLVTSTLYLVTETTRRAQVDTAHVFDISECLLAVLGDFCVKGWSRIPGSKAAHVICACSVLLGFLVNLVYVSQLQANLAVFVTTPPFEDLEGVVRHAQYNVLMLKGTLPHQYVLAAESGVMWDIGDLMQSHGNAVVPGFFTGMTRICTEKATLLGITAICDSLASRAQCAVTKSRKFFWRRGLSYFSNKRFAFRKLLDFYIRKCLEGGLYMGQKGRFDWEDLALPRDDGTGFREVEISAVVPFLVLYAVCACAATVVLLLELLYCACVPRCRGQPH